MNIFIRPNGSAQCLYGEKIDLKTLGHTNVARASNVEPDENAPGTWYADLTPVGGPVLRGFENRSAALLAEEQWLNAEMTNKHLQSSFDSKK